MEIPTFIFLIAFLLLAACFAIFSLFLLYHAIRFGVASWVNVFTIIIYMAGAALIFLAAYRYIASVDWNQAIKIL